MRIWFSIEKMILKANFYVKVTGTDPNDSMEIGASAFSVYNLYAIVFLHCNYFLYEQEDSIKHLCF